MPAEIALIRRDFADLVRAPESNKITLSYKTWQNPGDSPQIDEVYGTDRRVNSAVDVTVPNVQCVMSIVHARDLKLLAFGVINVGDVLFYFLDTINMQEPKAGFPLVPDTLFFQDVTGTKWTPVLDPGPMGHYLVELLRDYGTAQVVAAKLKK